MKKYYFSETKEKSRFDKWRPAPPGVAIGNYRTAPLWGTFGCVVVKNSKKMILSNNHVLAATNTGKKGDDIFQPRKGENIAKLHSFVPIIQSPEGKNKVDCALAEPNEEGDITPGIIIGKTYEPYFIPQGVMDASPNQKVKKCGAMSGYTTGTVSTTDTSLSCWYGDKEYLFEDLIVASKMCSSGDSGSLLMDEGTNKAVGLILGGSSTSCIACKIQTVLSELNCEIYTEEGGVIQPPFVPSGMIIDQSQDQWNGGCGPVLGWVVAQTFTAGMNGALGAISLHGPDCPPGVSCGGAGGGGLELQITKVVEGGVVVKGEPFDTPLLDQVLAEASISSLNGSWNTFYLSKPVPCHSGDKFAMVIDGVEPYPTDCPVGTLPCYNLMFSGKSSYPGGDLMFKKKTKTKWLPDPDGLHKEDLAFITWVIPPKEVTINSYPPADKIYIDEKEITP